MFLKLGRYRILVKIQETLSYGCYVSRFGLCQVKGGNTDFITFRNAIAFYFIVFFGGIGMGCCGLKRFPCAGDIFLILFKAARKCQHWSIRALLLQLPPSALSQASVPYPSGCQPEYLLPSGLHRGVTGPNAAGASVVYSEIPILWRFVLLTWI